MYSPPIEDRPLNEPIRLIQARGAQPTQVVGAFADNVIALPTETGQFALLVKGQAWVVRKIDEIPPRR